MSKMHPRFKVKTDGIKRALLGIVATGCAAHCVVAQAPPPSVQQLVKDVVYNELHDRERASYWQYRVDKQIGPQVLLKEQVDTSRGPIFRIIANGGKLLSAEEQRQEDQRLDRLLRDPGEQARVLQQQKDDEARVERLMQLMPDAFLYEYDGLPAGKEVRLKFRPNPGFVPPTYEARVFHSLAGTVTVDGDQKRLIDMSGVTIDRVDFAYGLLGHVEKGGSFEIHRERVTDTHWKTDLVAVHVQGKIVFFKTISKDQREARSQFRPVPTDISLVQAKNLLDQSVSATPVSARVESPSASGTTDDTRAPLRRTRQ
jgi:hypothetical protein